MVCHKCNHYYYLSSARKCESCVSYCLNCSESNRCKGCERGYFLSNDLTRCLPCSQPKCLDCTADGRTCTSCYWGYWLNNKTEDGVPTCVQYDTEGLKEGYNKLLNILAIIGIILVSGAVILLVQCVLEVKKSHKSSQLPAQAPNVMNFEQANLEMTTTVKKPPVLKSTEQKPSSKYDDYDESNEPISRRSFQMDGAESLDF